MAGVQDFYDLIDVVYLEVVGEGVVCGGAGVGRVGGGEGSHRPSDR